MLQHVDAQREIKCSLAEKAMCGVHIFDYDCLVTVQELHLIGVIINVQGSMKENFPFFLLARQRFLQLNSKYFSVSVLDVSGHAHRWGGQD